MTVLFKNAALPKRGKGFYVLVRDAFIESVENTCPAGDFDRVIDCEGCLLTPGLCNAHTHTAMTTLRGIGEDLPLDRWLNERIFPAEDRLSDLSVYLGSKMAIAEMLAGGVTSFSDMYFFCDATARAVAEIGIKANLSRSIVSFDENEDPAVNPRVKETLSLFDAWNGAEGGRILIDFSLHAEYTNKAPMVRYMAEETARHATRMHIHLSETEKENRECFERNGVSPTVFFKKNGLFEVPVICAHGVHLSDEDLSILADASATVVHNPISNLKLGSGIMPLKRTMDAGINVALGTDGAASNNRLDLLREMQMALLLQKGVSRAPDSIVAEAGLCLASENGYRAQGRLDCGAIEAGKRADLALFRLTSLPNLPTENYDTALAYSASSADNLLTMVDGRILYENGVFTTLDVEKLKYEFLAMRKHYFD